MSSKPHETRERAGLMKWLVGRGLPPTVILLGLTSLFNDVGTEMIFPLLPLFLTETLHASPTFIGLVEGAADSVASLLKLASGIIADKVTRRRPLVLFGYGLAAAARPLVAAASHPWQVLVVRVSDRIGKGVRSAPRDALIADAAGARTGRAFGFHQSMDNVGAVVGPLLAALLLLKLPIRTVFWLAAVPGAAATLLATGVRESAPISSSPPAESRGPKSDRGQMSPWLGSYLGILMVFSLGNSSDAFLLLRARGVGLPAAQIPLLWATLNLSKVVWAYVGGDLADRIARPRLIAGGWAVFAIVYWGLAKATAPLHVWALFALYGVFYGLTEPVEKALVKDLAPPAMRGRAYGLYNFVIGVAALPASLLTGVLWRTLGPEAALWIGAALACAAAAALLVWDALRTRPPTHPRRPG